MLEDYKAADDWQTWEDWGRREPQAPDGFKPSGPWYPFAAVAVATDPSEGQRLVVVYRRPLRKVEAYKP